MADRIRLEIQDRLAVQNESILFNRLAHPIGLTAPGVPRSPSPSEWMVDDKTIPACLLGSIHRDIGARQHLRIAEVSKSNPHACRNADRLICQHRRLLVQCFYKASATAVACSAFVCGSSTANSSPPTRASVSVWRMRCFKDPAIPLSRSSPAMWPNVSLTVLKLSTSIKSTAPGEP